MIKDNTITWLTEMLGWNRQSVLNAKNKYYSFWLLSESLRYTNNKAPIMELMYLYKDCGAKYWDVLSHLLLNDFIRCIELDKAKPFLKIPRRFR